LSRDPDISLLLRYLSDPPDPATVLEAGSWERLKSLAGPYGVAPLIAYSARTLARGAERAWCDAVLVDSWRRHASMLAYLEETLGHLDAAGVPAISLKGPLLASRYYQPAFLRKPSMDLDIAVSESHLRKACEELIASGYRLTRPLREEIARSHHIELVHPVRPKIELHCKLSHMSRGIPVDDFFLRTVAVALPNGGEARVLGPSDQLLHLLLHLAQSRFGTLFHLWEVRHVAKAESTAVRLAAIESAGKHGFSAVLRMVDVATRFYWNEPFVPAGVELPRTWLGWRVDDKLFSRYEQWSKPGRQWTPWTRLLGRWLDLQITDSPAHALRSLALLVAAARFPTARRDWMLRKHLNYAPKLTVGTMGTSGKDQPKALENEPTKVR
jgi:hypothetical protein